MHMADALLSPATGVTMWVASAGVLAWAAGRLRQRADDAWVPLMGVLGAFVFAAQMVNFSIPGTGASGHLGGGLLLAILLGPHAAFIVIASVLTVQALCFGDGGLLALGANMFNLGVLPCFLAYPLVYRPLAGLAPTRRRAAVAAVVAATLGLQLGALGVVLETVVSGISSLPLQAFLALMLPIHGAIGITEGLATAAIVLFLARARPELLRAAASSAAGLGSTVSTRAPLRPLTTALGVAALLTAAVLSWFASAHPDGLEWSLAHAMAEAGGTPAAAPESGAATAAPAWPAVSGQTSLEGVVGGGVTLVLVAAVGLALRARRRA